MAVNVLENKSNYLILKRIKHATKEQIDQFLAKVDSKSTDLMDREKSIISIHNVMQIANEVGILEDGYHDHLIDPMAIKINSNDGWFTDLNERVIIQEVPATINMDGESLYRILFPVYDIRVVEC